MRTYGKRPVGPKTNLPDTVLKYPLPNILITNDRLKESERNSLNLNNSQGVDKVTQDKIIFNKRESRYNETVNCWKCGWWTHQKQIGNSNTPECNKESVLFHELVKGK